MRNESFLSGDIWFPDRVVFVYNPNYIKLTRITEFDNVSIKFINPRLGKDIEINVALVNNSASVYISKFLQILLFDDRAFTLGAEIKAGDYSQTIEFLCVNGSLNIGERFGQIGSFAYNADEKYFVRRVRWFKNFPFEVSIFADNSSTELSYRYDVNGYTKAGNLREGFNDYDPKTAVGSATRFAVLKITPDGGTGTGLTTFDNSFDYTFNDLLESVSMIRLLVDNSTEGHYFRWVDPMGQLQYFLFTKGVEQTKVTESESFDEDVESNGMYFGVVKRVLEKTRTRELKCCAVNLTTDEQEYVKTIVSSIDCQMYIGKSNGSDLWMPVNVKAGTFSTSENENLQDFEVSVELPISQTQTR